MAHDFKRVALGERIRGWLANSWNGLDDRLRALEARLEPPEQPDSPPLVDSLFVANTTGAAVDAAFPVFRLAMPVNLPKDNADALYQRPIVLEGKQPGNATESGGNGWGVAQSPLPDQGVVEVVTNGVTSVKLEVVSEDDEFAAPIDGNTSRLKSGSTGARILWKEEQSQETNGERWAIVQLGGGGGGSALQRVIVDVNLAPAFWDDEEKEMPAPQEVDVHLLVPKDGGGREISGTIKVRNELSSTVELSEDSGVFGYVLDGALIAVGCEEFDFTGPDP